MTATTDSAPIGVFDSGIGGLSILRVLRQRLPQERWVYLADTAHAPYGERDAGFVVDRSLAIAEQLRREHGIKALVVACNTATAAAIQALRQAHPDLPIVGVEPGVKPALALTKTRRVGVLATRRTVESDKFQRLLAGFHGLADLVLQPCDGLAKAIEAQDDAETLALIQRYTQAVGPFGLEPGQTDTVVLGCTHYTLVSEAIQTQVGPHIALVDPADGVARQLQRVVVPLGPGQPGETVWLATAHAHALAAAVARWCPAPGH